MPELSINLVVEAPADSVWDVVGRRFDRIGEWATAIPASVAIPAPTCPSLSASCPAAAAAPVAGRVCETGIRLAPRVTEVLLAYDEANRTLTYEASGMPAFVTVARNTWTVTPLDSRHARVSLRAQFETRGLFGHLGRWAILAQVRRTSRHLAEDLRHYVVYGTPSPRKRVQLGRSR
jgi:Polyketide cyclase / dehydrase and lipid transport